MFFLTYSRIEVTEASFASLWCQKWRSKFEFCHWTNWGHWSVFCEFSRPKVTLKLLILTTESTEWFGTKIKIYFLLFTIGKALLTLFIFRQKWSNFRHFLKTFDGFKTITIKSCYLLFSFMKRSRSLPQEEFAYLTAKLKELDLVQRTDSLGSARWVHSC